jgi:membrane-associated phospholipid phosphatase
VTPFATTSATQFGPPAPPLINSPEYAAAVDEVQRLGSLNSTERTTEQTEIALFWADGGGTSTPAGHWNQIAADIALGQAGSLWENSRLFAALNTAMADAGIAAWTAKYSYDLWRPVDAIRRGDTDGNDATAVDPSWTPLLRTPPFPSYISGHSSFSGAAESVLAAAFGANLHFTTRADGHTGFTQRPLSDSLITTRSFDSFAEAADEAGQSRVYGGIHYQFDNQAGLAMGRQIGTFVIDNFFRRSNPAQS